MILSWNDQKKLAAAVGISPQFVNDILHRRRPCPPKRAHKMGRAYYELFKVNVPYYEFTFNKTAKSSVFKEQTYDERKAAEELNYGERPVTA